MPAIPTRRTRTGGANNAYVSLYAVPHLILISSTIKKVKNPMTENRFSRLDGIAEKVCQYYKVDIDQLKGRWRLREVVSARHMFFFIASFTTETTMVELGKYLNRDHTTVIHGRVKMLSFIQVGDKHTITALKSLCPEAIDLYKTNKTIL